MKLQIHSTGAIVNNRRLMHASESTKNASSKPILINTAGLAKIKIKRSSS